MIVNSPDTQATLIHLRTELAKIMAPYADTDLSQPVFQQIRMRFFSVVKAKFPGSDFNDWLTLVVDQETKRHIHVKLNHDRMFEYRDETPDWVYFVLWTFVPGWAPSAKDPRLQNDKH